MPCENESIEKHPGQQDRGEDEDERPRASESGNPVGESLAECLLLLKFKIGVATDMQALAEMLDDPMFTFR
jgi:hypothetical protein